MAKQSKAADDQEILAGLEQCAQLWKLTDAQTAALLAFFAKRKSVQLTRDSFADLLSAVSPPDEIKLQMEQLFCPQFGIPTDEEEDALEEELMQQGVQTIVPTPTEIAEAAAVWIQNPDQMIKDIAGTLNMMLNLCWRRLYDGFVIELRPEHRTETGNGHMLSIVRIYFILTAEKLRIRNAIEPTPFDVSTIENVGKLCQGPWLQFDAAIKEYERQLCRLVDWAHARQILNSETDREAASKSRRKATITETEFLEIYVAILQEGRTPTKELIRDKLKADYGGDHRTMSNTLFSKFRKKMHLNCQVADMMESGPVR